MGLALIGNTLVGVTAGVLIPMSLDRLGQDPALSSGIWLTAFTDVIGFSMFLTLGTLFLARLGLTGTPHRARYGRNEAPA